jgi:3-hydroxyisobutyrate dehydrogenase
MKIGFIGLGNMGAPMALNLAKASHQIIGYDISAEIPTKVIKANSILECVKDADIVITMLPNGEILKKVATEAIHMMMRNSIFLDCSTVDVESSREVAKLAINSNIGALDAPVSGGIGGAEAGTLTFMVGGEEKYFNLARELFDIMGQKAVLCGPSGSGQAAKICNNMILGATMIATCEAFALADKLNLSRDKMYDVVSTSSGYSWSMNAYCPAPGIGPKSPSDNNYVPGFSSALMLKDLLLSQQAAKLVDADTPIGEKATELYKKFVEQEGGAHKDFSAMLKRFEKRGYKQ